MRTLSEARETFRRKAREAKNPGEKQDAYKWMAGEFRRLRLAKRLK